MFGPRDWEQIVSSHSALWLALLATPSPMVFELAGGLLPMAARGLCRMAFVSRRTDRQAGKCLVQSHASVSDMRS
jgi:hypothetical protein